MKILKYKIILAGLIAIFLTGCISTKSQTFTAGQSDFFAQINLPNVIKMDGSDFTLKYKNEFISEFYLANEEGFNWTRLVSVGFKSGNTIQEYEVGLRSTIQSPTKYSIEYLNPNEFKYYTISKPMKDNPNFNSYEVNLGYAKNVECGFIIVLYAKNFSPNSKESTLMKFINDKMPIFLSSIPDIKCK